MERSSMFLDKKVQHDKYGNSSPKLTYKLKVTSLKIWKSLESNKLILKLMKTVKSKKLIWNSEDEECWQAELLDVNTYYSVSVLKTVW